MKLITQRTNNRLELAIPYDLVSTRIDEVKAVFGKFDHIESTDGFAHYRLLVVNLEGARMVDSAGLNFLVSLHKYMQKRSCEVHLKTRDVNLLRTFKFSRVDQYMKVIDK